MATTSELGELVRSVACELVEHPDAVVVRETGGESATVVELRVAKSDLGKVIGKEGRTAQALRTLLSALAMKLSRRAHLDIMD
jgi:predicted RNA-binding protein YlqC (UPF0109 family)